MSGALDARAWRQQKKHNQGHCIEHVIWAIRKTPRNHHINADVSTLSSNFQPNKMLQRSSFMQVGGFINPVKSFSGCQEVSSNVSFGLPQLLLTKIEGQAWANCPKLLTLPSDSKRFSMALISFTWDFFRNLETVVKEWLGSFKNSHLLAYRTGKSKTSLTSTPSCEFSRQNDSPCPQSSHFRSFLCPGSLQWICFLTVGGWGEKHPRTNILLKGNLTTEYSKE